MAENIRAGGGTASTGTCSNSRCARRSRSSTAAASRSTALHVQSMAAGAMMVVTVAVLASSTLLPALLHLLGRRVDRGRIRRRGRPERDRRGEFWTAWVGRIMRRPLLWFCASAGVLIALTLPAIALETDNRTLEQMPRSSPIVAGNDVLSSQITGPGQGEAGAISILVRPLSGDVSALGPDARRVAAEVARDAMAQIRDGRARIVYCSPERFASTVFLDALAQRRVDLLAVEPLGDVHADDAPVAARHRPAAHAGIDRAGEMDALVVALVDEAVVRALDDGEAQVERVAHRVDALAFRQARAERTRVELEERVRAVRLRRRPGLPSGLIVASQHVCRFGPPVPG